MNKKFNIPASVLVRNRMLVFEFTSYYNPDRKVIKHRVVEPTRHYKPIELSQEEQDAIQNGLDAIDVLVNEIGYFAYDDEIDQSNEFMETLKSLLDRAKPIKPLYTIEEV